MPNFSPFVGHAALCPTYLTSGREAFPDLRKIILDEENNKALAKFLAQVAIVSLSTSLGGAGLGTVLLAAGSEGAKQWLDRITARWNKKDSDFIRVVQKKLPALAEELGLNDSEANQEFHQALEAIKKVPISAATFAKLDFDAKEAANYIAEKSGHHRIQSPEQPAHKILIRLYELLPYDSGQIRSLDVAFQQTALALLRNQDAALKALAEQAGWAALLNIPAPPWRRRPTEAMLLDPAAAIVPYFPRPEDDELQTWLNSEDDIALRLYEAEGGAGKTRWMIEHCQRLSADGWRTGFLSGDAAAVEAPARAYETLFDGQTKTLIVVDYAETRGEQLNKLLNAAGNEPQDHPIRIVLLTRRMEGQWWASLQNRLDNNGANLLEEYPPSQEELPPFFLDNEARARFYASAREAFQIALSQQPGIEIHGESSPPALDGEHFKLPLFVSLAALERLLGGSGAGDEQALLKRLLAHEKHHWRRDNVDPEAVAQAMATITLWQGASRELVESLPRLWRPSTALHEQNPYPLHTLLNDLYGQDLEDGQTAIAPLRPDRLGETLVEEVLNNDAETLAEAAFSTDVPAPALKQGFTVLSRLPLRATGHLRTLGQRLAKVLKAKGELNFILQLLDTLPEQSVGLADFAAEMTRYALEQLRTTTSHKEGFVDIVGRLSNNLANRLSALGQHEKAFEAAQEAVGLYRELAQQRPDAFTPNLAMSLNNLANRLSELGQRKKALEAALEAVNLRRELAQQRPDAFTPDLAGSLNNLATMLSALSQHKKALEAALEATDLYRELAQQRPDAFTPNLAISLNNLATILSTLGKHKKALEAAQEEVDLCRELAQQRPDVFTPDLAMSLNNLANILSELGQREKALEEAQEAVGLYRELAQQRPDAFTPNLAMSLNNLANRLSELGQREKALEAAQEAADLYRELAQQRPDAFMPDLAGSLNNLAIMLSELGLRKKALEAAQEAVNLRRDLAQLHPDAFMPDLAMSLNNLAAVLSELGQREKALEAAQDAVDLRRDLAQLHPDAFMPDLATSLNNLAIMLSELGLRNKALEAAQEAVDLRRELAQQHPDAFMPDLAMSLNNLANILSELGQREKALEAAREAVNLRRELVQQCPDAFMPDLATSLGVLGRFLQADEPATAKDCFAEGIEKLTSAFLRYPGGLAPLMIELVKHYLAAVEQMNETPDETLLGPVVEVFAQLQAKNQP